MQTFKILFQMEGIINCGSGRNFKTMSMLTEIRRHDHYSGQLAGWMVLGLELNSGLCRRCSEDIHICDDGI
jgi:hypothetical protein